MQSDDPPSIDPTAAGALRVAIVAEDEADRAALSSAFAVRPDHRVVASFPLSSAARVLDGNSVDAIIGFSESHAGWRQFRDLAALHAETLSVLLVTDPERLQAEADGEVINAVVGMSRDRLAQRAAVETAGIVAGHAVERASVAQARAADREKLATLSERERQVLALTAQGLAMKQIAGAIDRTYATVASHRTRIMEKLALHDKVALTRFAIRVGLVEA